MTMEELYMFNSRNQTESDRLNLQHNILADFMGYELLHPSIDLRKKGALKIADVATGTGIWLKKLSTLLKTPSEGPPHYLHGFDISDKQFPAKENDISFSTHDATKCFPEEHLNTYDIVHVRLFVLALPEPEVRKAMNNIVQLLRPGGYLQWEDADWCYAGADRPAPAITDSMKMIIEYATTAGFHMRISECLMDQGQQLRLESLEQYDYNTLEKVEHYSGVRLWITQLLQALLPVTFLRNGRAENESIAQSLTCQMLQAVELEYARGVVPEFRIFTIVGRRLSELA